MVPGAESGAPLFLGADLLAYLVLALGGALAAGNIAAIVRPPAARAGADSGDLPRAPVVRSIAMATLGLLAAVWAIASLAVA